METQPAIICPPDLSSRPFGLNMERTIRLPVHQLFKAWTSQLDLWFASPGSYLSKVEPNAPYYFETSHAGERHPHYGRFLQIEEPVLVQFTWVTGQNGTDGAETIVTVALTEHNRGSLLRLSHTGFASETAMARHQEAWPHVLDVLEERMSRPVD